jgi:hypothetical protein
MGAARRRGEAAGDSVAARTTRGGLGVRRSEVTSLPVSGNGSLAAGVATTVAQNIARTTVDSTVVQRVEEVLTQRVPGGGSGATVASRLSALSRLGDGGGGAAGGQSGGVEAGAIGEVAGPGEEDRKRDDLLRFVMSDHFEDRLMELLEERLLSEIERRGGRYGGWFA